MRYRSSFRVFVLAVLLQGVGATAQEPDSRPATIEWLSNPGFTSATGWILNEAVWEKTLGREGGPAIRLRAADPEASIGWTHLGLSLVPKVAGVRADFSVYAKATAPRQTVRVNVFGFEGGRQQPIQIASTPFDLEEGAWTRLDVPIDIKKGVDRITLWVLNNDPHEVFLSDAQLLGPLEDPAEVAERSAGAERDRAEIVTWLLKNAISLNTPAPGHGYKDMQRLRDVVGDARIVSLGEATHGTREIFQMKHRMLEFLVEEMGFTVFGIEASYPDCIAINDFVVNGRGDPAVALHGQRFWTWDTEEVLDLVRWMRRYNEDPKHTVKLKFYGFDMQSAAPAVTAATAYLGRHDPEGHAALSRRLEPLRSRRSFREYDDMDASAKAGLEAAARELVATFDEKKEELVAKSSEQEWDRARRHAVIVEQWEEMKRRPTSSIRDRSMAENVSWILSREPAGTKIVLWAHNGHVKFNGRPGGYNAMGFYLEQEFEDDHVVFGFSFNRGAFQAINQRPSDGEPRLRSFTVGPAKEGSVDWVFAGTGLPWFVIDLRDRPRKGPVAAWFDSSRPMRRIGAVFSEGADDMWYGSGTLPEEYDAIIFLDETTRARPNPMTRKKFFIPDPVRDAR